MQTCSRTWCVVLAAGEGKRLQSVALGTDGMPIPKQFWKLDGNRSMLQWTLARARRVAAPRCIAPIVAAQHHKWWQGQLAGVPGENILVQPANRGTAAGVLLPLLHVYRRDPQARVVILPSDQSYSDESALDEALRRGLDSLDEHPDQVFLLGVTPDSPDPEYGYIVPSRGEGGDTWPVLAFHEKPESELAEELVQQGALWNAFTLVARVRTLLDVYEGSQFELLLMFLQELDDSSPGCGSREELLRGAPLAALYEILPELDVSRDVLQRSTRHLRVLPITACGWSDLGTPQRLARWIADRQGAHLSQAVQPSPARVAYT